MKTTALLLVALLPTACSPSAAAATKKSPAAAAAPGRWIARQGYRGWVIDRARFDPARAQLDPRLLTGAIVTGVPAGLRLEDVRWDSGFSQVGLQSGDVLTGLNGFPLRSLDEARAVLARLAGIDSFLLTLHRDGHDLVFVYRLGDPSAFPPPPSAEHIEDPDLHSLADVARKYWVRRTGDARFDVDAAVVMMVLPTCFPGVLASTWSGGAMAGALTPADDALRAAIGLEPGDQLLGVTPAPRDSIEIERRGRRLTIFYDVRPATREHPGEPLATHPELLVRALSAAAAKAQTSLDTPPFTGVKRVDATHFEIARATLDTLLDSFGDGYARCTPATRDGLPNGVKLYAIRPNGFLAAIGFANGDTLQSVNDVPVRTPADAPAAREKLRRSSTLTIALERRGQPMTLTYAIR